MGRNTSIIPKAGVVRIMRTKTPLRISDAAAQSMREFLEIHAESIVNRSVELSKHSGRTTVLEQDVRLVVRHQ